MPEAGTAVLAQINQFIKNAGKLSAFGAAGLTAAVFMLLLAIESAFVVETILGQLSEARYTTRVGRDSWVLARDLEETTLYDLYTDLDLSVGADALKWMNAAPWARRAGKSISTFDSLGRDCMAMRLKELFAEKGAREGASESEVIPFGRR